MTRGMLLLVTNKCIYYTTEYNGDMYWNGNGKKVFNDLVGVKTVSDLKALAKKWSAEYGYHEEWDLSVHKVPNDDKYFDFSDGSYIGKWFSDYLYIKNVSRYFSFIGNDGNIRYLESDGIGSIYFGDVAGDCPCNGFNH